MATLFHAAGVVERGNALLREVERSLNEVRAARRDGAGPRRFTAHAYSRCAATRFAHRLHCKPPWIGDGDASGGCAAIRRSFGCAAKTRSSRCCRRSPHDWRSAPHETSARASRADSRCGRRPAALNLCPVARSARPARGRCARLRIRGTRARLRYACR